MIIIIIIFVMKREKIRDAAIYDSKIVQRNDMFVWYLFTGCMKTRIIICNRNHIIIRVLSTFFFDVIE
jgi:hypothetical protein